MQPWMQIYDPLGNLWLSSLVAALPIFFFFIALAVLRMKGHIAGTITVAIALAVAIFFYKMPVPMALASAGYGFLYGLWPIAWIIVAAVFLYKITVKTGQFDIIRASVVSITDDQRLQMLLVGFSFGAFLEGAAGFGAPVAITEAHLGCAPEEQIRWLREFFDLPFPAGHTLPFRPELAEEKPLEICFSHVSFSHPGGDKRILDDVSFTLHAGEHTALVGINGAGKSTIVKLICGLYQPTEGNITINGIPLGSLNPAQYYKAIAAVFQDPFALSFSIAENVSCSPLEETDRNRCREALIRAGLWEKIASLPQKEETYLGKDMADDGITLSGGEMQKLMMARALYKNCHLLLLDEPTAALDAISENKMYETYSTLLKNKTALFISHRLASTRFCDTILFLENGKIKECGTHDELIALGGSYAHMFEVQSQYYQETEEDI